MAYKDPEKSREYRRRYYAEHREKRCEQRRRYYAKQKVKILLRGLVLVMEQKSQAVSKSQVEIISDLQKQNQELRNIIESQKAQINRLSVVKRFDDMEMRFVKEWNRVDERLTKVEAESAESVKKSLDHLVDSVLKEFAKRDRVSEEHLGRIDSLESRLKYFDTSDTQQAQRIRAMEEKFAQFTKAMEALSSVFNIKKD